MPRMFVAMPLQADGCWIAAQQALAEKHWSPHGWRCVLTDPRQWHLTWFFLNSVEEDRVEEVEAAISRAVESIRLADGDSAFRSAGVGCFAGPVWAGVEFRSETFRELLRDAREELERIGFESRGSWRPHLTLGRVKPDRSADREADELTRGSLKAAARAWFDAHRETRGEWIEQPEFVLIESIVSHEGAEHIVRRRWRLAPA